jgi:hypothetical protein
MKEGFTDGVQQFDNAVVPVYVRITMATSPKQFHEGSGITFTQEARRTFLSL